MIEITIQISEVNGNLEMKFDHKPINATEAEVKLAKRMFKAVDDEAGKIQGILQKASHLPSTLITFNQEPGIN